MMSDVNSVYHEAPPRGRRVRARSEAPVAGAMREHGVAQGGLAGRVAIVTGAASGMGAAAARALAREGARVVAADLVLAAAEVNAARIAAAGGEALVVAVDVSRAED